MKGCARTPAVPAATTRVRHLRSSCSGLRLRLRFDHQTSSGPNIVTLFCRIIYNKFRYKIKKRIYSQIILIYKTTSLGVPCPFSLTCPPFLIPQITPCNMVGYSERGDSLNYTNIQGQTDIPSTPSLKGLPSSHYLGPVFPTMLLLV